MKRHKVIFQPSGSRGEVVHGTTLLDAARQLGVDLENLCSGKGTCGKCKVRIEEGYFEKDAIDSKLSHVSEPTKVEKKFIKPTEGPGMRLACAAEVLGDVKVFVPEKSRAGKQIVRKSAREITVEINPAARKYAIRLTPPTLHDVGEGDTERLKKALEAEYDLKGLKMDYAVLKQLQDAVRAEEWNATVTVWHDREIIKVEPGTAENTYGLAVDVGTTTVVGYLCDMVSGKVVANYWLSHVYAPEAGRAPVP